MKKISCENLSKLYSEIASLQELYLPVKESGVTNYKKYENGAEVDIKTLKTVKSAKDFFFPQTEDMMEFKVNGKNIEINDARKVANPFVIFGVRACDLKSFDILDKVFLQEPVDTMYKAKREASTIITLACNNPEQTCFCKTFGIDASNPAGDISAIIVNGEMLFEAKTEKGAELLNKLTCLEDAGDTDADAERAEIVKKSENLPFANLNLDEFKGENLMKLFDRPEWAELSKACLGCGTCTFVCPTCQCFDIRDFITNEGVRRFRCWDSCMYSEFTKMAAENPRKTQLQRYRQRFMHKLVYFPQNNDGVYGCVGCGRCVQKCPQNLNIIKVIKKLGGKNND
ncbi:MAG: 4Fe-4S dicluster domain-containing protein [Clostridia bacterium]|nr:4Fe-4S dicluster domain-containing protein [Clostridia bacterium]